MKSFIKKFFHHEPHTISSPSPVISKTEEKWRYDFSCYELHRTVFPQFKDIYQGKDVVIVGTGPSLSHYNPIPGAIHVGLNRAYQKQGLHLDYLFWIDARQNAKACFDELVSYDCKKFFGLHCNSECDPIEHVFPGEETPQIPLYLASKNKAYRFYSNFPRSEIFLDIGTMPLMDFGSVAFPAIHFALWTHPKRIFLVGLDCSNNGHFNEQKQIPWDLQRILDGYVKVKRFIKIYYPDIEVISINPVGLRGVFQDQYTPSWQKKSTTSVLFLNDTENDCHFGCSATSRAIKTELEKKNMVLERITVHDVWTAQNPPTDVAQFFNPQFMESYVKSNPTLVQKIWNSSEVIVNGEGTLLGFENRPGTQNLLFLIYLALNYGKPVSIINHSCFPKTSIYKENPPEMEIYKYIYSKLKTCVVRDPISLAILKDLGISKVELGFDCLPLYCHNLYKHQTLPYGKKEYLLISGGVEFSKHFASFLHTEIPQLAKKFKKKIVFLMSATQFEAVEDLHAIDEIKKFNKTSKHKVEIFVAENTDIFLSMIEDAFFVITGRFHHSVASLFLATPFICFSTHSPKNEVFNFIFGDSVITIGDYSCDLLALMDRKLNCDVKVNKEQILSLCNKNFKF